MADTRKQSKKEDALKATLARRAGEKQGLFKGKEVLRKNRFKNLPANPQEF
jgi:hypothetical protein